MIKNKEFSILMKFLRERTGVSARQLSVDSGLSPSYISKVESGAVLPTIESFAKIVTQLGVSQAEIAYLISTLLSQGDHD